MQHVRIDLQAGHRSLLPGHTATTDQRVGNQKLYRISAILAGDLKSLLSQGPMDRHAATKSYCVGTS